MLCICRNQSLVERYGWRRRNDRKTSTGLGNRIKSSDLYWGFLSAKEATSTSNGPCHNRYVWPFYFLPRCLEVVRRVGGVNRMSLSSTHLQCLLQSTVPHCECPHRGIRSGFQSLPLLSGQQNEDDQQSSTSKARDRPFSKALRLNLFSKPYNWWGNSQRVYFYNI